MSKEWAGTTYGNGLMHKWLIRMLRVIDVRIIYAFTSVFVIPVCLIVNPSRRIIYRYMRQRQRFGRLKSAWLTYRNHCIFGQAVIDKFAMYAGKRFKIEIDGIEHFRKLSSQPEAFVQLSAHIGNYELAGYSLKADLKPLNALVFYGEKESVMQGRESMFVDKNIRMIAVRPDMSHLFAINAALSEGETVSLPADRIFGSEKSLEVELLDAKAKIPLGPFSLATMRGLDVITVNVMKNGTRRYKIYVTRLEYDKSAHRNEQISQLSKHYIAELERMLKMYPEQWYNYFEFWQDDEATSHD